MYRFLSLKKGFTLVELMITIVLLGILTAVAVPIAHVVLDNQKLKDCKEQRIVIQSYVNSVMTGMEDNGRPIKQFVTSGLGYFELTATSPTLLQLRKGWLDYDTSRRLDASTATDFNEDRKPLGETTPLASLFVYDTEGFPHCPFEDENNKYVYYIFDDGSVKCSCPKCNEYDN